MNIIPRFPGIVLNAETLPLDQVTKLPVDHPTIQDLLHHPLLFTIYNLWKWRRSRPSARDGVQRSQRQFDHIEDGMESTHRRRKAEAVHTITNLTVDWEWS